MNDDSPDVGGSGSTMSWGRTTQTIRVSGGLYTSWQPSGQTIAGGSWEQRDYNNGWVYHARTHQTWTGVVRYGGGASTTTETDTIEVKAQDHSETDEPIQEWEDLPYPHKQIVANILGNKKRVRFLRVTKQDIDIEIDRRAVADEKGVVYAASTLPQAAYVFDRFWRGLTHSTPSIDVLDGNTVDTDTNIFGGRVWGVQIQSDRPRNCGCLSERKYIAAIGRQYS